MRRKFVANVCMGMTQTSAARNAGFRHPTVDASQLMRLPVIQDAIRLEYGKYEQKANMSRGKVMKGLLEAVDIARTMSEPASMVAAWREVAKICGYYAPEIKNVNISVNGAVHVSQLEDMSDEDLAKLVIEGTAIVVPDEEELAALPAPYDDPDPDTDA